MLTQFFLMIECQHITIGILMHQTRIIKAHFVIRSIREFCRISGQCKTTLCTQKLLVIIAAKNVGFSCLAFIADVGKQILLALACTGNRQTSIVILAINSYTNITVFAKALADINIFAIIAITSKGLRIFDEIILAGTLSIQINSTRSCTSQWSSLIRRSRTIDSRSRTNQSINAAYCMCYRTGSHNKETRNIIYIISCGIRAYATDRKVCFNR